MKRRTKILLALGAIIVVAVTSIPLFVKANTFRPIIEMHLATALGRRVKLGDLSLSLFSGSLIAKDLSVADDPGFSAAPFLTAKEIRIGVSLRPLIFSHQVNLRGFQIESPEINVIRVANGTWNFSSIGHRAGAGDAASGISEGSAPVLPDLSVAHIGIEHGRAVIATLPAHAEPTVYEHVNFTVHDFSFASQFPFELSANLPSGGRISVTGHAGPINRDDAATSPFDAKVSVKRLDPVAAGFLNPDPACRS